VFLFIVPVVVLGTETVTHVLFIVVVPVLMDTFPVIVVNHESSSLSSLTTELIVGRRSPLLLRICIPDEFCGCIIFLNSFHFT
jgi:hypothetical protein